MHFNPEGHRRVAEALKSLMLGPACSRDPCPLNVAMAL